MSLGFETIPLTNEADFYEYKDNPADFSPTDKSNAFGFTESEPQGYHIIEEGDSEDLEHLDESEKLERFENMLADLK